MKGSMNQDIQRYWAESGHTHKYLENDTNRSSDLSCLGSIERLNRVSMRSKNVLDNMWFQDMGQKGGLDYVSNNSAVLTPCLPSSSHKASIIRPSHGIIRPNLATIQVLNQSNKKIVNTALSSYREIENFAVESAGSRSICTFD